MSNADLSIRISSDVTAAVSGINKVETGLNTIAPAATAAAAGISKLSGPAAQTFDRLALSANKATAAIAKVPNTSSQATQSLVNLSRVAQDAPYGFIGIANNLNPLLESFQRLKASTGSTKEALKSLGQSMTGAGGIGLALGVVSSLMVVFGDKLFGAKAGLSKFADVFNDAKDKFVSAAKTITELRAEIDLVNNGLLSGAEFTKHYNETLGKSAGIVDSFAEAQQKVIDKGEAYINVMLQEAIATIAFGKEAERIFKTLENFNKGNAFQKEKFTGLYAFPGAAQAIENKVDKLNKTLFKQADAYHAIGVEALRLKSEISSAAGLSFFGDIKPDKITIAPKKLEWNWARAGMGDIELPPETATQAASEFSKMFSKELAAINSKDFVTDFSLLKALAPVIKTDAEKIGEATAEAFNSGLNSTVTSGISSLAAGLGEALAGGDIKSAFAAFGQTIGAGLQAIGEQIIAIGVAAVLAKEALKKLFANPFIAIAAGLALVAAGAAFKSVMGKGLSGRATGGPVGANQPYMVGEVGREIFVPSTSGRIIPNNKLGGLAGAASQMVQVLVTGRIQGRDLVLATERQMKYQGRNV